MERFILSFPLAAMAARTMAQISPVIGLLAMSYALSVVHVDMP
jgi:hypothetical protein